MPEAILGKKIGMTRIFNEEGKVVPVTAITAGPCVVAQIKKKEKDGYSAAQLGFEDVKEKQVNKPLKGHFAKTKVTPKKYLVEVPVEDSEKLKVGDTVKADIFSVGDMADVIGISKGKGFTGVVKRWGFKGGPASHGSHSHRAPGSIGACSTPSRVHKGKKMPGRVGNERVTVQNLEVVKVVPEENLILVKGSVPGARGGLLLIRNAVKGKK